MGFLCRSACDSYCLYCNGSLYQLPHDIPTVDMFRGIFAVSIVSGSCLCSRLRVWVVINLSLFYESPSTHSSLISHCSVCILGMPVLWRTDYYQNVHDNSCLCSCFNPDNVLYIDINYHHKPDVTYILIISLFLYRHDSKH